MRAWPRTEARGPASGSESRTACFAARHISISFCFMSAAGVVCDARINRLPNPGARSPKRAGHARVSIGARKILEHRRARQKKGFQHALLHQRQRLRRDALHVVHVMPQQRVASILGLGGSSTTSIHSGKMRDPSLFSSSLDE